VTESPNKEKIMEHVYITRDIEAEQREDFGKPMAVKLAASKIAWEHLDTDERGIAYLRSNPLGIIYVTDELDALKGVA
jgi:hypothetical protein